MIGQRLKRVVEIGEAARIAVEAGDRGHGVAVGEQAELFGRRGRTVEAQAGRAAERDLGAADHGELAERAGALVNHLGAGRVQRVAEPLVLRQPRREGRAGGQPGGHQAGQRQGQRAPAPGSGLGSQLGDPRRGKTERDHQSQRLPGRQQEQQPDHGERAEPGAQQVVAVDPPHLIAPGAAVAHEGEADAVGGAEERHHQDQVGPGKPQHLDRVPGQLEGVDRDLAHERVAEGRGQAEQRRVHLPGPDKVPQQPATGERQETAAGAIAEQRDGDHHVGEVVPLADGVEPDQQHLVADRPGRDQRDRHQRDGTRHVGRGRQRRPVSGTKRTGSNWRVLTVPSAALVTRTSCWTMNGGPTGITMRPPGLSWATSGGGT